MVAFRAASAGRADTQAPTNAHRSHLHCELEHADRILAGRAATDNIGVSGLPDRALPRGGLLELCADRPPSRAPATAIPGLRASTSYSYRVRATDAAGEPEAVLGTSTARTHAGHDRTRNAPSAPTNLAATGIPRSQINLELDRFDRQCGSDGVSARALSGIELLELCADRHCRR